MKIQIGFLDDSGSVAIGEANGPGPIEWSGPGARGAQEIATHYAQDHNLTGADLLSYMVRVMRGRSNWARVLQDDRPSPGQFSETPSLAEYLHRRSAGKTLTGEETRRLMAEWTAKYGGGH